MEIYNKSNIPDWKTLMLLVSDIITEGEIVGGINSNHFRTFGMRTEDGEFLTRINGRQLFKGSTLEESVYRSVVDYYENPTEQTVVVPKEPEDVKYRRYQELVRKELLNKSIVQKDRVTPDNITKLKPGQIFVFGSNESGLHGGGAAKTALKWGAIWNQAEGIQGKTYGIPTKSRGIKRSLKIQEIKPYVSRFIEYAKKNPNKNFLVTEIGCGLAGLTPNQVACLFKDAVELKNVSLSRRFWDELIE